MINSEENQKYIESIVRKIVSMFPGVQLSREDLRQRGWLELIRAASRYDEEKGVKFTTFTKFVEYFMLEPFCEKMPTAEGSCEYIPINIIDGSGIEEGKGEIKETVKVRDLREEGILNMLERLEGMILMRTANMENAVKSYRENRKDKGAEKE